MSNKTIIITGAEGNIGSYFCEYLLQQGYAVIGATYRDNENLFVSRQYAKFSEIKLDITDQSAVQGLIAERKPNYFINCAAISYIPEATAIEEKCILINSTAVLWQLEAIRAFSPSTRYLNIGTSEEVINGMGQPQTRNIYGLSKRLARETVARFRQDHGIYALQSYCWNTESPRHADNFVLKKITNFIARNLDAINDGNDIEPLALGNIQAKRNYTYVTDMVDGLWKMINQDQYRYDFFNKELSYIIPRLKEYQFCSSSEITIGGLVKLAFDAFCLPGDWWPDDSFRLSTNGKTVATSNKDLYRSSDDNIYQGDACEAIHDLSWHPLIGLSDLVIQLIDNEYVKSLSTRVPSCYGE